MAVSVQNDQIWVNYSQKVEYQIFTYIFFSHFKTKNIVFLWQTLSNQYDLIWKIGQVLVKSQISDF